MSSTPVRPSTFISLQTLFKTVTILLSVSILLTLVLTTFDFYNPEFVYLENPTEEEEVVLLTIGLVGILNAIISVAGGIFFLWWFYRAYKNLKTLGIALKSTPRRVIVNFFIPIINFWKPYFAAMEIWNKSDPSTLLATEQEGRTSQGSVIVKLWWITTLIGIFLIVLESVGFVITYALGNMVSIIAAILQIFMIKEISLRQETISKMAYR
ncbi:MAG: DUF4328 domain-containing protein [Nitrososphaeraceae archaeon]